MSGTDRVGCLFEAFEHALHEVNRDRFSTSTGFIVGLAQVALPDLHVSNLSGSAGLEIFLHDVSPDEVELFVTLGTFQESSSQFL